MRILRSFVAGNWFAPRQADAQLIDPCTEEVLGGVSTQGIDFDAALRFSRERGGAALRALSFAQRGELLSAMSKRIHAGRDELIELSLAHMGATRRDAKFDIDGGTFTLAHYATLAAELGERPCMLDGAGVQLGRSARFWGQHVLLPLSGVAVHVNAFNFPVWGFAEKAACALLAGMPVITKPATSSAALAERCFEMVLEARVLPEGVLSLVCGPTGDLLDRLGSQDVLGFTGSAATALGLRGKRNLLAASARVNIEADSLNAAVLAPGTERSSETWAAFIRDVSREMTQKTGQKCTAVRRIFVPRAALEAACEDLVAALGETVTGNPREERVTMGPLATRPQLDDALLGLERLREECEIVSGTGARIDGVGNPAGKGFFVGPTLLVSRDAHAARAVHEHEVFGPVATVLTHDGTAGDAAALVARGGGSLVTSLYGDDLGFIEEFVRIGGANCGRLYIGSEKVASQLPGSGLVLPQLRHGGPGRAGGGDELGGLRGLELYLARVALAGDRSLVDRIAGKR